MAKKKITSEEVVAEYLTGNITYRALGIKHGIPSRSICDWVLEYQGRKPTYREKMKKKREKETGQKEVELTNDVKILQAASRKSQIHIKILEEIIHLSEEYTGIDLKKKFGTKQ